MVEALKEEDLALEEYSLITCLTWTFISGILSGTVAMVNTRLLYDKRISNYCLSGMQIHATVTLRQSNLASWKEGEELVFTTGSKTERVGLPILASCH